MRSKSTSWDTFVVKCAFLSCHVSKDLYWQYEMFINILLLRIEVLGTVHNVSMNALMHAARGQYREVLSFLHQRIVPYGCQKYLHCCIYSSLIDWRVGGGWLQKFSIFPIWLSVQHLYKRPLLAEKISLIHKTSTRSHILWPAAEIQSQDFIGYQPYYRTSQDKSSHR